MEAHACNGSTWKVERIRPAMEITGLRLAWTRICRERERDRDRDRDTERERQRETERETETERQRDRDRQTEREREREKDRQTDTPGCLTFLDFLGFFAHSDYL